MNDQVKLQIKTVNNDLMESVLERPLAEKVMASFKDSHRSEKSAGVITFEEDFGFCSIGARHIVWIRIKELEQAQ